MKLFSALMLFGATATIAHADTAIETETAQIGKQGEWNFSQSYEFERAPPAATQTAPPVATPKCST